MPENHIRNLYAIMQFFRPDEDAMKLGIVSFLVNEEKLTEAKRSKPTYDDLLALITHSAKDTVALLKSNDSMRDDLNQATLAMIRIRAALTPCIQHDDVVEQASMMAGRYTQIMDILTICAAEPAKAADRIRAFMQFKGNTLVNQKDDAKEAFASKNVEDSGTGATTNEAGESISPNGQPQG